jgi:hypothetical protein
MSQHVNVVVSFSFLIIKYMYNRVRQHEQRRTCSVTGNLEEEGGGEEEEEVCFVIALRPQTPKRIRGGWSHYTDTSEPVDGGVGTLRL